jgi:hypothetical protein
VIERDGMVEIVEGAIKISKLSMKESPVGVEEGISRAVIDAASYKIKALQVVIVLKAIGSTLE